MRARHFLYLIAFLFLPPTAARAEDSSGTLHIVRPSINALQDSAELCLEFDHTLDLSDRGRLTAGIMLESEDKKIDLTPADIGVTDNTLCVENVAYRQPYTVTVAGIRGAGGEKLNEPYKLSFTAPDRHPSLAFAGDPGTSGFVRYRAGDPVLRAVNVAHVHVTLYRVADPGAMADAWRQRLQTTLAPSESVNFAGDNGRLVWQGEMVLATDDKNANHTIERALPLRAALGSLDPGLYLVAVADTAVPKKGEEQELAPLAAQWFVRSDLRVHAAPANDGVTAEAETADASAVVADAHLSLIARDRSVIADGRSGADGTAFLNLPGDRRDGTVLMGTTEAGDVDFAGLAGAAGNLIQAGSDTAIIPDRAFYKPGAPVTVTLAARNAHGDAIDVKDGAVDLLRADQSTYISLPVPDVKDGLAFLSFAAPLQNGSWEMAWHRNDGSRLANLPLRITNDPRAPHVEIKAEPGPEDEIHVTVASLGANGKPAAAVTGHILTGWSAPDTLAGWNDYRFGTGDHAAGKTVESGAFLTGADGTADLHLKLKPPAEDAPLQAATIAVQTDRDVLAPGPVTMALPPKNTVVGVRPLAPGGKFAENSLARFDIVAVGADGKRRDLPDLSYQVYEEGRSFAWFQADGRWDYKPLQQRRRIGGGALSIKASGTSIRWPVAAGAYTLEISDTAGTLLARTPFDAGWGLAQAEQAKLPALTLKAAADTLEPGQPAKINFTLDAPAVITAVIADDRIRKIVHEARKAGDNEFDFTPDDEWGNRISVSILADMADHSANGRVDLALHHDPKQLTLTLDLPDHAGPGQDLALGAAIGNLAIGQSATLRALATSEDTSRADVLSPEVHSDGSKQTIRLTAPDAPGDLQIAVTAANSSQWGRKETTLPVRGALDAVLALPPILHEGDTVRLSLSLADNAAAAGAYHAVLTATPGLKAPAGGTVALAPGETRDLSFNLAAVQPGTQELRLDLTGPQNFRLRRVWPVAVYAARTLDEGSMSQIMPQQNFSAAPAGKGKNKNPAGVVFLSAEPLFGAPQLLANMLAAEPFTTAEIGDWLEAARRWRGAVVSSGLMPAEVLRAKQDALLLRAVQRQQPDGGFPDLPGGKSDLAATAAILPALVHAGNPAARPAVDIAGGWLQHILSNSWFDESERPARAEAFAAMADASKLDVAALRYFAETSSGKTLPPQAMAALASALQASNDADKAAVWLKAAQERSGDDCSALPLLAGNSALDPRELEPNLQKCGEFLLSEPAGGVREPASFLRAMAALLDRGGEWRATVNGGDVNMSGVFALNAAHAEVSIRNQNDRPLYLTQNNWRAAGGERAIARHFYRLEGGEVFGDGLRPDTVYLVTLEGSASAPGPLFVHDDPGAGMRAASCTLDYRIGEDESRAWLADLGLTAVAACEQSGGGIDAVLSPAVKFWRLGYLAKTGISGTFIPEATARAADGESVAGGTGKIQVK